MKLIIQTPYERQVGTKGLYDEYYNCAIGSENQVLNFSAINRDGYR